MDNKKLAKKPREFYLLVENEKYEGAFHITLFTSKEKAMKAWPFELGTRRRRKFRLVGPIKAGEVTNVYGGTYSNSLYE